MKLTYLTLPKRLFHVKQKLLRSACRNDRSAATSKKHRAFENVSAKARSAQRNERRTTPLKFRHTMIIPFMRDL